MKVIDGQVFVQYLIGLITILVLTEKERERENTPFGCEKKPKTLIKKRIETAKQRPNNFRDISRHFSPIP